MCEALFFESRQLHDVVFFLIGKVLTYRNSSKKFGIHLDGVLRFDEHIDYGFKNIIGFVD